MRSLQRQHCINIFIQLSVNLFISAWLRCKHNKQIIKINNKKCAAYHPRVARHYQVCYQLPNGAPGMALVPTPEGPVLDAGGNPRENTEGANMDWKPGLSGAELHHLLPHVIICFLLDTKTWSKVKQISFDDWYPIFSNIADSVPVLDKLRSNSHVHNTSQRAQSKFQC